MSEYLPPVRRLVEKAHLRQVSINRASSNVTEQIFEQQSMVKQRILDQISLSGREERDALGFWRKLILHNTHSRFARLVVSEVSFPPLWRIH